MESNLDEIRLRFHDAFEEALENSGYEVVDVPRHDALRLHVEIIDLRVNRPADNANLWRDRFMFRVLPGHFTLVAELADSTTGNVLLRMADVDAAFDMWSATIGQTISQGRTNGDMLVNAL